jgi:hypothetical protein
MYDAMYILFILSMRSIVGKTVKSIILFSIISRRLGRPGKHSLLWLLFFFFFFFGAFEVIMASHQSRARNDTSNSALPDFQ